MCCCCHLTSKEKFIASELFHLGYPFPSLQNFSAEVNPLSPESFVETATRELLFIILTLHRKNINGAEKCRHPKILLSNSVLFLKIKDQYLIHH